MGFRFHRNRPLQGWPRKDYTPPSRGRKAGSVLLPRRAGPATDLTTPMTTVPRIRILPDLLVNRIAAGEVVERPASVVKELVENSLDAGATRIALAMEEGGRRLIRVTDDGAGMTPAELRLAVLPHATSKLPADDDLYRITTLGFRGEALASISAVADLRIRSRTPDAGEGHEIHVVGEQLETSQAAGCPPGTIVEVRDLFFNVPARRKFLRAASTETGHINEQMTRLALAHPAVGFEVTNHARVTVNAPPGSDRRRRIARFFGDELAEALLHVERSERGLRLEAYLAPPAQSRATPQWQYAFVNHRFVRDRFLQHAVREGFRGLMEPNRHAVVFLFLEIDPSQVDVNVHPTKIEVRWADSSLVHSQVLSALRETLQRADLTPRLRPPVAQPSIDPAEQERIRREFAEVFTRTAPSAGPPAALPPERPETWPASAAGDAPPPAPLPPSSSGATAPPGIPLDAETIWRSLYSSPAQPSIGGPPEDSGQRPGRGEFDARPVSRAIQLHNLYLVAETEDGIIIIDQHALHERIMYEQLRERITRGPLESQRLLLPETIRVTPRQADLLDEHADLLHRLGLDLSPFAGDAVAIHALPTILKDADAAPFVRDLLDQLEQQPEGAGPEKAIHPILDMMACKAAVKAGDPLSPEEIEALMRQRHLVDKSSNCPHGRPTTLRLTKADLDRQFKRT